MSRSIRFTMPSESSLFTPMQLQARAPAWMWMSGWARWTKEHWVSFRKLIQEYQYSVVVLGYTIEFVEPLGFYDVDDIDVEVWSRIKGSGRFVESNIHYYGANGLAVRGRWVLLPVKIQDAESLAAQPAPLSDKLLAMLPADELFAEKPANDVPQRLERIQQQATPVAEYERPFTIHRHHCEVADQWCFAEIPSMVAESREAMALAQMEQADQLVSALSKPLSRLDVKLTRPLYVFEEARIDTTAYHLAEESTLFFVHRIQSEHGTRNEHGVIIEEIKAA